MKQGAVISDVSCSLIWDILLEKCPFDDYNISLPRMTLFQQKRATDQDIIIPLGNGNGKRKQEKNMRWEMTIFLDLRIIIKQSNYRAHYHIYYT